MGRGRAKAKQIKVARKLKYYSPDTDLSALQKELGGESADAGSYGSDDFEDDYSDYAEKYNDFDDEDDDAASR
ncbi:DUF3073 domain-containing protein [Brevibacterium album]|uniref:DUF3073 domain-containing protein n=1 Tax=Brevibacterium album TaxID=417948 RepID=UPI000410C8F1|nr:DUF3073 domain-containing protein [Brevibacterium album]